MIFTFHNSYIHSDSSYKNMNIGSAIVNLYPIFLKYKKIYENLRYGYIEDEEEKKLSEEEIIALDLGETIHSLFNAYFPEIYIREINSFHYDLYIGNRVFCEIIKNNWEEDGVEYVNILTEELKKEIENRYSFIDFELRNFSIFQNAVKDKKLEEFDEHLSIVDDLLFFISCDILEYLFRVYKNKEVKGYEILMDTGYQIHVNEILVRYSIDDL